MDKIAGTDDGGFYFLFIYRMGSPDDMEEMTNVLRDPEIHTTVESWDDDRVVVKVRMSPEDLVQ